FFSLMLLPYSRSTLFPYTTLFRSQIRHIEIVMEQQQMVLNDRADRDIFGYSYDKGWMCVQVFFVRQGKLIERDVSLFPFFDEPEDRKSTRLNSSHVSISYAVFCLK